MADPHPQAVRATTAAPRTTTTTSTTSTEAHRSSITEALQVRAATVVLKAADTEANTVVVTVAHSSPGGRTTKAPRRLQEMMSPLKCVGM